MDGEDDDIKEDAHAVDDQGQEDGVLAGDNHNKDLEKISILVLMLIS